MNGWLLAFLLAAVAPNAAVARGATAPAVEIRIALRTSTLWVGEPIRVEVHWRALAAGRVKIEHDDLCFDAVRLIVRGPRGQRVYREPSREMCEALQAPWDMKPGEEARTRLVFFGIGGWLDDDIRSTRYEPSIVFPRPGEYVLRLVYIGGQTDVSSNEVQVSVEMPPPDELPLLREILREPTITYVTADWPRRLQQYPTSRYLAWSRIADFGSKLHSGALLPDREAEDRRRLEIVAEMLAQEWGQFEEEALALAYRTVPGTRKTGPAGELAARLRAKFPGSWTLDRLGLDEPDEEDDEPQQQPGARKP